MKGFLRYLITALVGLSIVCVIVLSKKMFSQTSVKTIMQIWSDAFFAAGVFLVCGGLIVFASNGGVFDMMGYSITLLFSIFRSSKVERKYKTYYDYRESRREKKRGYGYILIVGAVFVAIAAVFLWLYYAN